MSRHDVCICDVYTLPIQVVLPKLMHALKQLVGAKLQHHTADAVSMSNENPPSAHTPRQTLLRTAETYACSIFVVLYTICRLSVWMYQLRHLFRLSPCYHPLHQFFNILIVRKGKLDKQRDGAPEIGGSSNDSSGVNWITSLGSSSNVYLKTMMDVINQISSVSSEEKLSLAALGLSISGAGLLVWLNMLFRGNNNQEIGDRSGTTVEFDVDISGITMETDGDGESGSDYPVAPVFTNAVPIHDNLSLTCTLCSKPRTQSAVSSGGYLFCNPCLVSHVTITPNCPISGLPCNLNDIILLH